MPILNEDETKIYNKWVKGIAKGEQGSPGVITVDDIINRFRNRYNHEAPKILPYPLSNILDIMGNIFISSSNLRNILSMALQYPIFKKDRLKEEHVSSINRKLEQIQNVLFSITEDLNKIVDND